MALEGLATELAHDAGRILGVLVLTDINPSPKRQISDATSIVKVIGLLVLTESGSTLKKVDIQVPRKGFRTDRHPEQELFAVCLARHIDSVTGDLHPVA